mmetsp:Transcript_20348/g.53497  ORF Transcript_20348/g.53497 Transcript_20348/m.53497 type:complete len:220 (-) Transcript_20348:264-923(-)
MASGPAASPTRCANVQRRPVPPRGAAKIFASVTVRTAASPRPCPGPTSRGSSGRVRPRAMLAYDLSGPSRTSDEASGTSSSGSSSIDSASDPTPSSAARMLATESAAARAWSAWYCDIACCECCSARWKRCFTSCSAIISCFVRPSKTRCITRLRYSAFAASIVSACSSSGSSLGGGLNHFCACSSSGGTCCCFSAMYRSTCWLVRNEPSTSCSTLGAQ